MPALNSKIFWTFWYLRYSAGRPATVLWPAAGKPLISRGPVTPGRGMQSLDGRTPSHPAADTDIEIDSAGCWDQRIRASPGVTQRKTFKDGCSRIPDASRVSRLRAGQLFTNPFSTPAWDTFRDCNSCRPRFCKASPGWSQPTAFDPHESNLAPS